jgi:3-methyladenine DNA glycosylase AlkD
MTLNEILSELESYGNAQTKKTLMNHGAREPLFGVKVGDLKKILKKTKKNHELSLELFKTGNSDAMYLAGLMADEKKITESQLNEWVNQAYWSYVCEYSVPMVASETKFGFNLGLKWIASDKENLQIAGWSTLSFYAGITEDEKLDIKIYSDLLNVVEKNINSASNRVKYRMNAFVIAVGSFISELTQKALAVSEKYGKIEVDMGKTSCKVPDAKEYIQKMINNGFIGKKRKVARC